jgi:CubicO group peptidase (beta-lactamase class C family)
VLERVVALLEDGVRAGWHRGAQLEVRSAGRPPLSVCVGEARDGVPMTADVLLPWFSCTKPVTAVGVAQLVERGAVSFDDPVWRHVPEFAANGKEDVLVRHVLTHTGASARSVKASTCGGSSGTSWSPPSAPHPSSLAGCRDSGPATTR